MIELWDGYFIGADDLQFILGKPVKRMRKDTSTEETIMSRATYHPSVGKALQMFYKMQLRKYITENNTSLAEAITAFSNIEDRILKLADPERVNELFLKGVQSNV